MSTFTGFPAATRKFLRQLERNNEREWFRANKARYEAAIVEPALGFIEAMEKPLAGISEHLVVAAQKSGGSLMRIYRDTRFAKDKTPYKTNIGIQFRHAAGKDVHAPGLYVHIEAKSVFVAAGVWHPDSKALLAIREQIAAGPGGWKRVRNAAAFKKHFELSGESLQRPPRGFDAEHPMVEDLKRKDFMGVCQMEPAAIESAEFKRRTVAAFKGATGFVRYLCGALDLPY